MSKLENLEIEYLDALDRSPTPIQEVPEESSEADHYSLDVHWFDTGEWKFPNG